MPFISSELGQKVIKKINMIKIMLFLDHSQKTSLSNFT